MFRAELRLARLHDLDFELLRLLLSALTLDRRCEVGHCRQRLRMVRAELHPSPFYDLHLELLRLFPSSLIQKRRSKVGHDCQRVRMVSAELRLNRSCSASSHRPFFQNIDARLAMLASVS
ncbi:uncharacterized protein N7446_001120 [Penicillium canescens]|uniref:Uncharacterized protein n=1 Tax=Penicillium canescens TaxID=5083 RepID=A0AAD6I386_PENCN|nr:uncharacterized protein N7446_001120 [Penicillium canescens]KAJ6029821.1 hypothetical protein N7460_010087 [Penicillium canescens]KAJ6078184.1 hypothetical protein N7446_001120 [Penicillium canescens]